MLHRFALPGPFAALLLLPVFGSAAATAPRPPCFDVEVRFLGRDFAYAKNGTSWYVWHYRVSGAGCIDRGLSHWTLSVCPGLYGAVEALSDRSLDNSAPGGTQTAYRPAIATDPVSGSGGIKWDYAGGNAVNVPGEYDDFSFTAPGEPGTVSWAAKGGTFTDSGTTTGPVCGGSSAPVAVTSVTWGRVKARFSGR